MSDPKESRFDVLPKASVRPNKIVFYNQFFRKNTPEVIQQDLKLVSPVFDNNCQMDMFAPPVRESFSSNPNPSTAITRVSQQVTTCNQHSFELSKKAAGRIKEKVSWLYELAKIKTVVPLSGQPLYSFKMNFITLTLPSLQAHTTAEINSRCLNQFLTECKQKWGLANYVWRLEFQKNGNAHYHIATDTYIEYQECRIIWNRCLAKLGYIAAYKKKFVGMTLAEYCRLYSRDGKDDFNTLRARYGRGCQTAWEQPNTVDIRAVGNAKNIAFYISKYITKKSDEVLNPVVAAREPESTNLRLWFCSKSLSALDKITFFMDEYDELFGECMKGLSQVRQYIFDYCQVWYFNGKEQVSLVKRQLWQLYRRYATERGYIPAG